MLDILKVSIKHCTPSWVILKKDSRNGHYITIPHIFISQPFILLPYLIHHNITPEKTLPF